MKNHTFPHQNQMSLVFNETEGFQREHLAEPMLEEITYKRKKTVGHKEVSLKNLPTETIIYDIPVADQECLECGEMRKEFKIVPAQVSVVEHVQLIYSCRNCEKKGESVSIVKSTLPEPIIKGSIASPSAVAHIMTQKFVNAVPIYRQEQDYKRNGIELSRQTMSNWVNRSALDWLEPLYEELKVQLLKREVLCVDETTLQVLKEPDKKATSKSYIWLYRTGADELGKPIVIYEYQPNRSAQHPKLFLKGYVGYIHSDGYAAYHQLPSSIVICGCVWHMLEENLKRRLSLSLKLSN